MASNGGLGDCDRGYCYDDKEEEQRGKQVMAIWQRVDDDNDNKDEEGQKGRRAIWQVIRFHSREPLVMR